MNVSEMWIKKFLGHYISCKMSLAMAMVIVLNHLTQNFQKIAWNQKKKEVVMNTDFLGPGFRI